MSGILLLVLGSIPSVQQTNSWPPAWLEGAWKVTSVHVTKDGRPSTTRFLTTDFYVFHRGYRFAVYRDRKVSALQLLASENQGDASYCLFARKNKLTSLRAKIERTEDDSRLRQTNEVLIQSKSGRFQLHYQLERVADTSSLAEMIRVNMQKEFSTSGSVDAKAILSRWTASQLEKIHPEASK